MGGAAVTVPVPNCSGRGTPTCQGMEQSWGGGGHSLASARSPPLLVSPGQLHVPSTHAWGPAAALGGHWGPPQLCWVFAPLQALVLFGGAVPSAPLCGLGGDRSLWLDPGPPCPRPPPLSITGAVWGGVVPLSPPMAGCPPHLAICPRGGLCLSPHPVPWLILSLGLTNYGALDSGFTIVLKLLLQAGLGGSAEPPLHGDPRVLPPGGAGGLWPPGHAKLAFVCPRACRLGCGHPKTRGTPPKTAWGLEGCGGDTARAPSAAVWSPGGLGACPVTPPGRCPRPPSVSACPPPAGS